MHGAFTCFVLTVLLCAIATAQTDETTPFSLPDAHADFETLSAFRLGNAVFRQVWTPAGEGPAHFDGLGPLFNAASCEGCHIRDGRGAPVPAGGAAYEAVSMLLKLGRPAADGAMAADPVYGEQLQDFALAGFDAEGRIAVTYEEVPFAYPDGTALTLRRPRFSVEEPAYGPLAADTILSPRIAPPMIGLGLIARIPEVDILAAADPGDADGDGISGSANWLTDGTLGRFGWKAGQPSLEAQIALAFSRDMGVATALHPEAYGDCTERQAACRTAPDGRSDMFGGLEAHSVILGWAVTYAENLKVPPQRDGSDPDVIAGGGLFSKVGCAACHRPSFTTGPDPDQPHLANREIAPHSDFLLHDMGEDLADDFREGAAEGSEWRTAPLWGIGLTQSVNGNMAFLHDGRARTVEEAILWHGGEAAAARDAFVALDAAERQRLLVFLAAL